MTIIANMIESIRNYKRTRFEDERAGVLKHRYPDCDNREMACPCGSMREDWDDRRYVAVPLDRQSYGPNMERCEALAMKTGKPHYTRGWMGDLYVFVPHRIFVQGAGRKC